jgi:hypothetical protein
LKMEAPSFEEPTLLAVATFVVSSTTPHTWCLACVLVVPRVEEP